LSDTTPLAVLERLWNVDKHRLLTPGYFALAAVSTEPDEDVVVHNADFGGISWRKAPLRVGETAFTFQLTNVRGQAGVDWSGQLHPTVCFDDGERVYESLAGAIGFAEKVITDAADRS
jgi:hypothetical protein